jgi:hypothetical protein
VISRSSIRSEQSTRVDVNEKHLERRSRADDPTTIAAIVVYATG